MKVLVLISAILALVAASDAAATYTKNMCLRDAENRIFESKIKEALHALRDKLKAGDPEKGIPPLDPLNLDNFALRFNNGLASLNLAVTGLINGLMSWNVTDVSFNMLGYRFKYEITFPLIDAKVNYDVNGNLIQILPMYGNGDLDAKIDKLVISGDGKFSVSLWTQKISLERFSCNINLQDFLFRITGLMNDEPLSELLSQMITDSVPELLITFQDRVNSVISTIVIETANRILGKYNEREFKNFLSANQDEYELFARKCEGY